VCGPWRRISSIFFKKRSFSSCVTGLALGSRGGVPTTTACPRFQAVRAAIPLCWPAPGLQFLPARAPSLVLVLKFCCARIAETWAHRFGIIPPPAAQQQTQSPRQVCVGASVWAFFLARLHWRHLSWPATHIVCSQPEEWTDGTHGTNGVRALSPYRTTRKIGRQKRTRELTHARAHAHRSVEEQ
jgi:hypothetical protein